MHLVPGKLRAFGVASLRRSAAAPDIPTLAVGGSVGNSPAANGAGKEFFSRPRLFACANSCRLLYPYTR
jgi:hypothetical protein